jgi:hypothetical protein
MRIAVHKNPPAQRIAHTPWSTSTLNRGAITPAMRDIADKILKTLRDFFSGGIKYTGEMAAGFDRQDIGPSTIAITQSAEHEKFIREGTTGPYKAFPGPVVTWAEKKLGVTRDEAFAIATSVMNEGTADFFVSLYPVGERRFEYGEWAVEVEHKKDIDKWAQSVGGAVVEFITTGDVWRST